MMGGLRDEGVFEVVLLSLAYLPKYLGTGHARARHWLGFGIEA
jgi:hypothetical protein